MERWILTISIILPCSSSDDAIASGSNSKQRRANLQRVANIEADVTAVQKKRRRKAQTTNNQPLFIAKRKEPKAKKSAVTEKPKFNKKQREKIQERNATMKETYAKVSMNQFEICTSTSRSWAHSQQNRWAKSETLTSSTKLAVTELGMMFVTYLLQFDKKLHRCCKGVPSSTRRRKTWKTRCSARPTSTRGRRATMFDRKSRENYNDFVLRICCYDLWRVFCELFFVRRICKNRILCRFARFFETKRVLVHSCHDVDFHRRWRTRTIRLPTRRSSTRMVLGCRQSQWGMSYWLIN